MHSTVAISDFLRYLRFEKRMSTHTITAYANDLNQLFTYLMEHYTIEIVEVIKLFHLRSWLANLKEHKNTETTLKRKASAAKSFFKYLQKNSVVENNPAKQLVVPKAGKRLPVFLEEQETEKITDHLNFEDGFKGLTERLIIEILYQTGIRRAELAQLKESDIEIERTQIKVLGKRNKERLVPLNGSLLIDIKNYVSEKRKLQNFSEEKLLIMKSGSPVNEQYIYRTVNKHLNAITTLTKKSPHVLRHTFATQLSNNGAELNAIKDLLGHSSLAATQVYTHTNIEQLKEVYRKAHPKS